MSRLANMRMARMKCSILMVLEDGMLPHKLPITQLKRTILLWYILIASPMEPACSTIEAVQFLHGLTAYWPRHSKDQLYLLQLLPHLPLLRLCPMSLWSRLHLRPITTWSWIKQVPRNRSTTQSKEVSRNSKSRSKVMIHEHWRAQPLINCASSVTKLSS